MRKSVCAMFRNLEFTSGPVDCDSGFVRMCFENVFQCHVLLSWMTFASAFFILIALDNGVVACVLVQFECCFFASFQTVVLRDRDRNRWTAMAQSGATLVNVSALVLKLSFHK